jgi:Trk K+ transport system NAD-binding subunit
MKFVTAQVAAFLEQGSSRRNIKLMVRFLLFLGIIICLYSVVFHVMMEREGREFTWLTGFYWTLTVMSTLGFGDITFETDLGRVFSMVVLVTGTVFLLVLFPFTLIEFFYAPWVHAQNEARAPRRLPVSTRGHVILTHFDAVSAALIRKLNQYRIPYVILVPELEEALKLFDEGYKVVVGESDMPETYKDLQLDKAAMVAATGTDVQNTNVSFTVRELYENVAVVATARTESAEDIMNLAGCSHVFRLGELMGQSLARRTIGGDAVAHVIGHFDKLLIAEAAAADTPIVGKTLAEIGLRTLVGVNLVGVWERGEFQVALPDTKITQNTMLVMAGTEEQFHQYNELFCIYHQANAPVVIIGGGRVGRTVGDALRQRNMDYRIVDKIPERLQKIPERSIVGDAAELEVLEKAGIMEAPAVLITTRDDDVNIYLTIFCRKLRPDIEIISRATLDRKVSSLHRAGADFVMSYASMGTNIAFNFLRRSDILMVAEGLNIFRVRVPETLQGKTMSDTKLREKTGCHVIAVVKGDQMNINPDPADILEENQEILLISDAESEEKFFEHFGHSEN